jgi:polyphosphate kinase
MTYRIVALAVLLLAGFASNARAQMAPLDREELTRYARAYLAMDAAREAYHARIARIHDDVGLARARAELDAELAQIFEEHAITSERYGEITLLISQDAALREVFEEIVRPLRGSTPGAGA